MGIGATVKNMLSTDSPSANATASNSGDRPVDTRDNINPPYETRVGDRTSHQLPPGTGPGTSGRPAVTSEKSGLERSKNGQDTSGYGTDAAAAMGGTLAGTHQGVSGNNRTFARNTSTAAAGVSSDAAASSKLPDSSMNGNQAITGGQAVSATKAGALNSDAIEGYPSQHGSSELKQSGSVRQSTNQDLLTGIFLEDEHDFGHTKDNQVMGGPKPQDKSSQLHPVVRETVRHLEFEEIAEVKDRERNILHVQHHTVPIIVKQEMQERLRDYRRPVTRINEIHANKPDDSTALETQIYKNRDSVVHHKKERHVINKGTTVNSETVHHHIHHVIQPVIEKEIIERERIRTTIPFHEVTHEAPIVHQSMVHNPINLDDYLKKGHNLDNGISQDEIIRKVLHLGKCTREIDGGAHSQVGDMNKNQASVAGPKN